MNEQGVNTTICWQHKNILHRIANDRDKKDE